MVLKSPEMNCTKKFMILYSVHFQDIFKQNPDSETAGFTFLHTLRACSNCDTEEKTQYNDVMGRVGCVGGEIKCMLWQTQNNMRPQELSPCVNVNSNVPYLEEDSDDVWSGSEVPTLPVAISI